MHRATAILGPQRREPTLAATLDELGVEGPVAVVTAGWQEREEEVEEMRAHLGRPVVPLRLYARAEQVFAADPRLAAAYRARQDRLKQLQELYRLRLAHSLEAARQLMARDGPPELLDPERRAAIEAVRALDAAHLARIAREHAAFTAAVEPASRPAVARHRHELARQLAGARALAVAGGHVAVLLNRLRLFAVAELAAELPTVAWSAGAMALAGTVVLFHDSPPQGAGDAEVLEAGLGLFTDALPLPHARSRLRLGDPLRVALFARRFAPAACVALEAGSRLLRRRPGEPWEAAPGTLRLGRRGRLLPMEGR